MLMSLAGADDAEAGEPQSVDGLAGERAEILRHAFGVAQRLRS